MDSSSEADGSGLRIALVTATRDRRQLFEALVEDLKHTEWPTHVSWSWHVSDDASHQTTFYGFQQAVNTMIPYLDGPVTIWRNSEALGCDQNVVLAVYRELTDDVDWVGVVDSDMSLHPLWATKLIESIEWAAKEGIELDMVGAFNSAMHGTGSALRPGLVEKGSIGGPCTFIRASLLRSERLSQRVGPTWGKGEPGWDWKLVDAVKKKGTKMAALSPSYAQHMGRVGAHAPAGRGPYDQANDFIGKG
ncbi:MAG: hypothetical protein GTO63_06975 [Anaerolineae bacterium]|nr:hypothetical protein [Anaerolineae bacterium]NIN94682.1 hypothetical protein [Anaerolineae bacterium]NIQ77744.1 hypothetical protein [Anaerolineae bacterium]